MNSDFIAYLIVAGAVFYAVRVLFFRKGKGCCKKPCGTEPKKKDLSS